MSSRLDLQGRVAFVVGGTSGIGRTLALGLADAGADVVASARRSSHIEEVAAEIEAKGRRTLHGDSIGSRDSTRVRGRGRPIHCEPVPESQDDRGVP